MADLSMNFTKRIETKGIAQAIDAVMNSYEMNRRKFERSWYDNNFFDDGYHFRYVSKETGKIVDLSNSKNFNAPQRAIPKASRQIRGVANLLMGPEYTPVIYPSKVSRINYKDPNEYQEALKESINVAKRTGQWVSKEFDRQEMLDKVMLMLILSAKHGVSYMQIWPDSVEEKIRSQVFDAFDIYLKGDLTEIYDSPSIIKTSQTLISQIKANEEFDKDQLSLISPDNKYASSEIKQAYMTSRYGYEKATDFNSTLILKEAFIKEYLDEENKARITQQENAEQILTMRKSGDVVIRHVFSAGGVWLKDEYLDIAEYPFIDFRYEPGPIYQVPMIERFIPANKSLDVLASRIEQYANTMTAGIWSVRAGEDFQISNIPGGQKVTYKNIPPQQVNLAPIPGYIFNFMDFLEKNIEEQGASTSALGNIPNGVKSGVAIESVKSIEYANLKIPGMMLKKTMKRIAQRTIDIGSSYVTPQTVYYMNQGKPDYFEIIGEKGIKKRKDVGLPIPSNIVEIKGDYYVDIEVESGLGFTQEGKKQTAQQIITFMLQMAESGLITQDSIKVVLRRLLDTYQFGATEEFMDALDSGTQASPLTEEQLNAIKIAVVEAMKDSGMVGPEADEKLVDSTKIGTVEALKDTGLLDQFKKKEEEKKPSVSISYKDLSPEGKSQAAAQADIMLTPEQTVVEEPKEQSAQA